MTRHVLAALSHDGHARAFLDQPRREIAMRAAMIALETVAHRIQTLRREITLATGGVA